MNSHSPSPGVLETVVADEDLLTPGVSTHASRGEDVSALSKQVKKAYRKALKASKARDVISCQICAVQRAKREGTAAPVDPVMREEPAAKVQMSLSDF